MIIQNCDYSYQVMHHLGGTGKSKEYLCREIKREQQKDCLLVEIKDQVLAKNFMIFLEEKIKGEVFSDYWECFWADGKFYAVFSYSAQKQLPEKLETERCSLNERAEIAKRILERLLLQNPHPYFAWNALRQKQITVSSSMEVQWNYHLEKIEKFDTYSIQDVAIQIYRIFQLLFEEERNKKLYPELKMYMQQLQQGQQDSYLKLYQDFMTVYAAFQNGKQDDQVPLTFGFRAWQWMKKLLGICKKVLMIAILVLAVLYVVDTFRNNQGDMVVTKIITQIGDLTIE